MLTAPKLTNLLKNYISIEGYQVGQYRTDANLSAESNFEIARTWLGECRSLHKGCLSDPPEPPTRILSVCTDQTLKIELSHGKRADYLTLNHRRGSPIDILMTTSTLESFLKSLPFEDLP